MTATPPLPANRAGAVPSRKPYACPRCGRRCRSFGGLTSHARWRHSDLYAQRCALRRARRLATLRRYREAHGQPPLTLRKFAQGARWRSKTLREFAEDPSTPYVLLGAEEAR